MTHSKAEAKPTWQSVPLALRRQVETNLGGPVTRARRVWGGYSPTPTFRLSLKDARKAFFKGTSATSTEFAQLALAHEELVYRELGPLIGEWMPKFYAAFTYDDWRVLLLEDVGPLTIPPWTPAKAQQVTVEVARFHVASRQLSLPNWLPKADGLKKQVSWKRIVTDSNDFQAVAGLAGAKYMEAFDWLTTFWPWLARLSENIGDLAEPPVLLHGDIRSDNLRLTNGKLKLFDWPFVRLGPAEYDLVEFAQSVTVEGGIAPETIIGWYNEHNPVNQSALETALAWWVGFFLDHAWRPEIPELPRLRRFQRQQLKVLLSWTARQMNWPSPDWVDFIEV